MNDIGKLIKLLEKVSYKNRFSIYYQPNKVIVRTYKKDGSQYKSINQTLRGALLEAISKVKSQ